VVSRDALEAQLDRLDGLLVPGGNDVDPFWYGEERSGLLQETDRHMDDFHLTAIRLAWNRGLPVLGICRGIQIINVAAGGSLWQDVSLAFNGDTSAVARHSHIAEYRTGCHDVAVKQGSRLDRILGLQGPVSVNSLHHQVIKRLGAGLGISATAADGCIEAIESIDTALGWTVAVQWHPELMTVGTHPPMAALFNAFAAVCAKRSAEA
jgi:putative glutamine amidotransferase